MKSWSEFSTEEPELAEIGRNLLFRSRAHIGCAFLATLRKDGAPRLHPVSLVYYKQRLYVLISPTSPKCADLKRDGRYAIQAYPSPNDAENEEFYLSGRAECIRDLTIHQALITETKIHADESEVLFELKLDRLMYTRLVNLGTPDEHPLHRMWRASGHPLPSQEVNSIACTKGEEP
jgi:Pyridoxamine 5'-phosphate oxidase